MAIGIITRTQKLAQGGIFKDLLSFAGDASYPTGGTVDFEGSLQAKSLDARELLGIEQVGASGYVLRYDDANDKLMVFYSNADAADGPLIEVPNTTDLSATTFKVIATSK